jgi:hypothetical protein
VWIAVLVGAIGLTGELAVLIDGLALAIVLAARREALPWLAAAIAGGLAISAPQWLPAVASIATTAGGEVHGLPLARLLELIVPGSFGASDSDHAVTAVAGATPWAPSLFVGAPLLALAAVRPPAPPRRRDRGPRDHRARRRSRWLAAWLERRATSPRSSCSVRTRRSGSTRLPPASGAP